MPLDAYHERAGDPPKVEVTAPARIIAEIAEDIGP